ncbi:MAG: GNAT family N-acetyltransferase [Alphaproteobacteria bacterium]|jgi:RimJ/RimL family protein N-acetyltransferase|nr:GNAT family N-acetyltransferase [Alphaproteobacteria bacterium]
MPPHAIEGSKREIETERLRLRPFRAADGDLLYSLYGDDRVMSIRKIGPQTRAQSDEQLRGIVDHWGRRGFGLWGVFDKADGAFLGECGLREIQPGDGEAIELTYGLVPEVWGRGLGSEAGRVALDWGFEVARLETVYAVARADNRRSRRVMEKLGFRFEKEWDSGSKRVVRYIVQRTA